MRWQTAKAAQFPFETEAAFGASIIARILRIQEKLA
jgi:hypothetical protein